MRRSVLLMLAALAIGACADGSNPAEPAGDEAFAVDFAAVAYGMTGPLPGAGLPELQRLKRLPAEIALTAEQEATITQLLEDFQAANQAGINALVEILNEARAARQAGKPRAEIAAILERARSIHLRLAAASAALRVAIDQVLTTEQRTWLVSRSPARCYPDLVPPLNARQRQAIQQLHEEYREETTADRAAVRAALQAAKAAREAGASRQEIAAILESVKDDMQRLQEAGNQLRADLLAVLTDEQRASGCFGGPPPGGEPKGRG